MSIRNELKQTLTQWWEYMAVRAACQLDVFDLIDEGVTTADLIAERIPAKPEMIRMLLDGLVVEGYLEKKEGEVNLTPKGELLTQNHPESLKQAAILWGGEQMNAWQELEGTLKTGAPAFETLFGTSFFKYLEKHPRKIGQLSFGNGRICERGLQGTRRDLRFQRA